MLPKDVIPHGIYIHVHFKGWKDGEGMKLWLEKVWSKRPGGLHVTDSKKDLPLN